MIPYDELLRLKTDENSFSWSDRETILYALSTGFGANSLDLEEQRFVYEENLQVVPTFATVVAGVTQPSPMEMGIDYLNVVLAEQGVTIHRPLPAQGKVIGVSRVVGALNKGPKGTVIRVETILSDAETRAPLVTLSRAIFARADDGNGAPTTGGPPLHAMPDRAADASIVLSTGSNQALLYRLCGDRNPLHADPRVARAAGFVRPILHGLCTFGMSCRAVLRVMADCDAGRILDHQARFSSPMYPGEPLTIDLWRDGNVISFEGRSAERGVKILTNGRTLLGRAKMATPPSGRVRSI